MSKAEFIWWFKDIKKKNIASVGGKAANLGEMFAKFPIPNGFCVTVKAFENFLGNSNIDNKIASLTKNIDVNKQNKIELISIQIKKLIIKAEMSKELQNSIIKNYTKIDGFVAVRSSAVAEDLEEASFAGQQATFLNVKEKDLIKYVKKCWASFYTTRAIIYREQNKFDHQPKMAVIVQKMIDAKKSGVIFTVNPVNKNRNEMIIESVFGLGEALVSGMVTPDHFVVDKNKQKIIKEIINEKKIAIFRKKDKNITTKFNQQKANQKTLNDNEINQLIKEALKIEKHYKKPMDIEWAIDDKIYILQARPITTL